MFSQAASDAAWNSASMVDSDVEFWRRERREMGPPRAGICWYGLSRCASICGGALSYCTRPCKDLKAEVGYFLVVILFFLNLAFLLPSISLGVTRAQRSGPLVIDGLNATLANA